LLARGGGDLASKSRKLKKERYNGMSYYVLTAMLEA